MRVKAEHRVPKQLYQWLKNEALGDLEPRYYTFMARMIHDTFNKSRLGRRHQAYITREHRRNIDLGRYGSGLGFEKGIAKQRELYKYSNYKQGEHSRIFRLGEWFYTDYIPRLRNALVTDKGVEFVNLYTGLPVNRARGNVYNCPYRPAAKPLIRAARKKITRRLFNKPSLLSHLNSFDLSNVENSNALASVLNDLNCWSTIVSLGIKHEYGDIWSYRPRYDIQSTGRIGEKGGCLQSCSLRMKAAAIQGIDNLHNYDLKNSQINGLRHQLRICGLDTSWLDNYISNKDSRKEMADAIGITEQAWKRILIALAMGASSQRRFKKPGTGDIQPSPIYEMLKHGSLRLQRYDKDDANTEQFIGMSNEEMDEFFSPEKEYDKLLSLVNPALAQFRKWHKFLKKSYYTLGNTYGRKYNGKVQIKNYLGIPYYIDEYKTSELAARILQGQESAFIHNLTILSDQYNFEVIANEHDGLITLGEIPEDWFYPELTDT